MKILNQIPPNYELILASGLKPTEDTIYCFGDTIYSPSKKEIAPDLEHHEYIHSKQQGDNPDSWWYNYLRDEKFRLEQEIIAYREQYRFAKEHNITGRLLDFALDKMAMALSSEVYNLNINFGQAKSKIRNYGKK